MKHKRSYQTPTLNATQGHVAAEAIKQSITLALNATQRSVAIKQAISHAGSKCIKGKQV